MSYRSLTHQFEVPIPWLDQPGYTLWDANLRYSFADERYSIGLHAKNILNKRYITSGYNYLASDGAGGYSSTLGQEGVATAFRSEEHTSELQSLMRISYAVFCLKKKKTTKQQQQWYHKQVTNEQTPVTNKKMEILPTRQKH